MGERGFVVQRDEVARVARVARVVTVSVAGRRVVRRVVRRVSGEIEHGEIRPSEIAAQHCVKGVPVALQKALDTRSRRHRLESACSPQAHHRDRPILSEQAL